MKNLKEKLNRTVRTLTDAELGQVSGGMKPGPIVFNGGSTITVTNSCSGGCQDDCLD